MSSHRVQADLYQAPWQMRDPGSGGTIYVSRWGAICPVVTAGAEARTLAAPTKAGILCTVLHHTYAGALTLTVTGGYNYDGDTSITLGDAGDFVTFLSMQVGSSYYWKVIAQEGTNVAIETLAADTITATDLTLNSLAVDTADMTEGAAGITAGAGTICEHRISKFGTLIKTEILVDLTGLNSGGSAGDIIGVNSAADCHIGQITAAKNGTIFAGSMRCLETPATGEDDIDLYCATESTGTEDAAVGGLVETALLDAGENWTAAMCKGLTANPAANQYLYLVSSGGATAGTYTAGIFEITLWGK